MTQQFRQALSSSCLPLGSRCVSQALFPNTVGPASSFSWLSLASFCPPECPVLLLLLSYGFLAVLPRQLESIPELELRSSRSRRKFTPAKRTSKTSGRETRGYLNVMLTFQAGGMTDESEKPFRNNRKGSGNEPKIVMRSHRLTTNLIIASKPCCRIEGGADGEPTRRTG